jgi:hypothetical protein
MLDGKKPLDLTITGIANASPILGSMMPLDQQAPAPATKLRRQVKSFAALAFLGLRFEAASGSTVEARGRVIVGESTRWHVG